MWGGRKPWPAHRLGKVAAPVTGSDLMAKAHCNWSVVWRFESSLPGEPWAEGRGMARDMLTRSPSKPHAMRDTRNSSKRRERLADGKPLIAASRESGGSSPPSWAIPTTPPWLERRQGLCLTRHLTPDPARGRGHPSRGPLMFASTDGLILQLPNLFTGLVWCFLFPHFSLLLVFVPQDFSLNLHFQTGFWLNLQTGLAPRISSWIALIFFHS